MQARGTVLALEEIRNLKARYCRFLDTKDWHSFAALFTAEAVLDVRADTGMDPFVGRDVLIAQIRRVVTDATTVHQVHTPEIELLGPDEATAIWAMQDRIVWADGKFFKAGIKSITAFGHYHERYFRRAGEWQIASVKLTRLLVEVQQ
jgi:SnoaL-like domain